MADVATILNRLLASTGVRTSDPLSSAVRKAEASADDATRWVGGVPGELIYDPPLEPTWSPLDFIGPAEIGMLAKAPAAAAVRFGESLAGARLPSERGQVFLGSSLTPEQKLGAIPKTSPKLKVEYGGEGGGEISGIALRRRPLDEMSYEWTSLSPAIDERIINPKIVSPESFQGGTVIPLIGDRTAANRTITKIGDVPVSVRMDGGPGYALGPAADEGAVWASNRTAASGYINRVNKVLQETGRPVYGVYTPMSTGAGDSTTMAVDAFLQMVRQSPMTKKDVAGLDKMLKGKVADLPSLKNIDAVADRLINRGSITERGAFIKPMMTAKAAEKHHVDPGEIRLALTEPSLVGRRNLVGGDVVVRWTPESIAGLRSPDIQSHIHPNYTHQITGQYLGRLPEPLPQSVLFPEFYEAAKSMNPSMMMDRYRKSLPQVEADQKWIDAVMRATNDVQKRASGGRIRRQRKRIDFTRTPTP